MWRKSRSATSNPNAMCRPQQKLDAEFGGKFILLFSLVATDPNDFALMCAYIFSRSWSKRWPLCWRLPGSFCSIWDWSEKHCRFHHEPRQLQIIHDPSLLQAALNVSVCLQWHRCSWPDWTGKKIYSHKPPWLSESCLFYDLSVIFFVCVFFSSMMWPHRQAKPSIPGMALFIKLEASTTLW